MSTTTRRIAVVLTGLAFFPNATEASSPRADEAARSFTLKTSGGTVARIGTFRPRQDPGVEAAERAFGRASSRKLIDNNACTVEWRSLRLTILFVNFGLPGEGKTVCDVGSAQTFTVKGTRFRTWEGLRVRHRSATIPQRHKSAEFREGSWWLRSATSPYGDNEEYAVVRALVSKGRVTALKGWIGAGGD